MTQSRFHDAPASDGDAGALVERTASGAPGAGASRSTPRRRVWLLIKLAAAAVAFAFIFLRQPWSELQAALARITPGAFLLSCLVSASCLGVATLRWRLLMHAYGATRLPRLLTLLRVYFVGQFYNTYLPGGVGGDVVRGVVTRHAFATGGTTSGVTTVLVERALGLFGMVGVFGLAAPYGADAALRAAYMPYCMLGVAAIVAVVSGVALGRRFARYAPARIAPLLAALPELQRPLPFAAACLLSLVTQTLVALAGHILLSSIDPEARFVHSLLATPLAAGAAFLPISVGGAGPRDVVLVTLYIALGVPRAAATATALSVLISTLVVAGLGGVLQLFAPLAPEREQTRAG